MRGNKHWGCCISDFEIKEKAQDCEKKQEMILITFLLTILIESGVYWISGSILRQHLLFIFLVNSISYAIVVVLLITGANFYFIEFLVVLIELILLQSLTKFSTKTSFYIFLANLITASLSLVL